jgi:hypothetical protein
MGVEHRQPSGSPHDRDGRLRELACDVVLALTDEPEWAAGVVEQVSRVVVEEIPELAGGDGRLVRSSTALCGRDFPIAARQRARELPA